MFSDDGTPHRTGSITGRQLSGSLLSVASAVRLSATQEETPLLYDDSINLLQQSQNSL